MGVLGKGDTFTCPHDHRPLVRFQADKGVSWRCPTCGGVFATLPFLRKILVAPTINELWQESQTGKAQKTTIDCPSCGHPLLRLKAGTDAAAPELDVCRTCQAVWFDRQELDALPPRPQEQPTAIASPMPQEAREKFALFQIERIGEQDRQTGAESLGCLQAIPFLLGWPVPMGGPRTSRFPLMVFGLAGFILSASLLGFADPDLLLRFGLVPDTLMGPRLLTILTSLFLHGGILHLVENLYFLYLFGPLAEDALGRKRFLALFFLAGVAGGAFHAMLDPRSSVPLVGASGCLSGIMAYVALAFPSVRFKIRWYILGLNISAELYFLFWFFLQLVSVFMQAGGIGQVSAAAHIAGALAGAFVFFRCRKPRRSRTRNLDID